MKPRMLTADGETLSLAEWSRRTGLAERTISSRLLRGWSVVAAVTVRLRESAEGVADPETPRCSRCGLRWHTVETCDLGTIHHTASSRPGAI